MPAGSETTALSSEPDCGDGCRRSRLFHPLSQEAAYSKAMILRQVLPAAVLGVTALLMASLALRTTVQAHRGAPILEPRLLAYSQLGRAIYLAIFAAGWIIGDPDIRTVLLIVIVGVSVVVTSFALESVRNRRINGSRPKKTDHK